MTNYQTLVTNPTKKVSIGMPVFNVADYVHASLTSALNQDMDDIENNTDFTSKFIDIDNSIFDIYLS